MSSCPSSEAPWLVWVDWSSEEVLAILAHEAPSALLTALAQEKVTTKTVSASTRYEAVRQAFPERFVEPSASQRTVRSRVH